MHDMIMNNEDMNRILHAGNSNAISDDVAHTVHICIGWGVIHIGIFLVEPIGVDRYRP